ncbi:MAG TPA: hypothetical protein PKH07_11795, partial [bacterium]|nr:hypothetical protein [bacterium]
MIKQQHLLKYLVIAAVCFIHFPTNACEIPVYEYALRFWSQDDYLFLIYHKGVLSESQQSLADSLTQSASDTANFLLRTVDLETNEDPQVLSLLKEMPESADLPRMSVHYPISARISKELFSMKLSRESVEILLNSPLRSEIARRLMAGDAAVWVLLESGEGKADDSAAQLIQSVFEESDFSPETTDSFSDADSDVVEGVASDAEPAFSLLRLPRNEPEERTLIELLLNTESDLKDASAPIAFPIYGRGRVLYALVGKGITRRNVEEACRFITGPCSCLAREDNPGIELLMNFNWESAVEKQIGQAEIPMSLSSVSSLIEAVSPEPIVVTQTLSVQRETQRAGRPLKRNMTVALVG